MAIPYVKQTWTDGSGGGTPASAARLGVIEQGIFDAHHMPAARVYHSTGQTTATGVTTTLAFNSERFDTDTIHDTVTNNDRLTCKTAGVYQITGNTDWTGSTAGFRQCWILLNGATPIGVSRVAPTAVGGIVSIVVTTLYQLAVNDYVQLLVLQDSGSTLTVNASANYSPEFSMVRVA